VSGEPPWQIRAAGLLADRRVEARQKLALHYIWGLNLDVRSKCSV
jgi:hypothetical protein